MTIILHKCSPSSSFPLFLPLISLFHGHTHTGDLLLCCVTFNIAYQASYHFAHFLLLGEPAGDQRDHHVHKCIPSSAAVHFSSVVDDRGVGFFLTMLL